MAIADGQLFDIAIGRGSIDRLPIGIGHGSGVRDLACTRQCLVARWCVFPQNGPAIGIDSERFAVRGGDKGSVVAGTVYGNGLQVSAGGTNSMGVFGNGVTVDGASGTVINLGSGFRGNWDTLTTAISCRVILSYGGVIPGSLATARIMVIRTRGQRRRVVLTSQVSTGRAGIRVISSIVSVLWLST